MAMDAEQKAEMDRIAEQVRTINEGGGSTFYEEVKKVADQAAASVISAGKNAQGKTIYKIGRAKHKGGPIQKRPQMMHGGAYKGKKHAYTAGGSVHSMNMGRKK
jgi:predicted sugar kinase|tara:strand:+ start:935 stop:1246 length:312 start_codon:yes stop_codon:yes gene_type:complete